MPDRTQESSEYDSRASLDMLRAVQMVAALRPPTRHTADRIVRPENARRVAEGILAALTERPEGALIAALTGSREAGVDVCEMLAAVDLVPGVDLVSLARHTGPTSEWDSPWSARISATPLDGGNVVMSYVGEGQTPRETLTRAVEAWVADRGRRDRA